MLFQILDCTAQLLHSQIRFYIIKSLITLSFPLIDTYSTTLKGFGIFVEFLGNKWFKNELGLNEVFG